MQDKQVELLGPLQLRQAESQSIQVLFPLCANWLELHEDVQVDVVLWKKYPYAHEVQITALELLENVQFPQLISVGQMKQVFAVSLA